MKKIIIILLLTFSFLFQAGEKVTINDAFSNDEVVIPLATGATSMGLGFLLGLSTMALAAYVPEVSVPTLVVVGGASLSLTAAGALITTGGAIVGLAEWATNEFK